MLFKIIIILIAFSIIVGVGYFAYIKQKELNNDTESEIPHISSEYESDNTYIKDISNNGSSVYVSGVSQGNSTYVKQYYVLNRTGFFSTPNKFDNNNTIMNPPGLTKHGLLLNINPTDILNSEMWKEKKTTINENNATLISDQRIFNNTNNIKISESGNIEIMQIKSGIYEINCIVHFYLIQKTSSTIPIEYFELFLLDDNNDIIVSSKQSSSRIINTYLTFSLFSIINLTYNPDKPTHTFNIKLSADTNNLNARSPNVIINYNSYKDINMNINLKIKEL